MFRFLIKGVIFWMLLVHSWGTFAQEMSPELQKKAEFIYELAKIDLPKAVSECEKLKLKIDDYSSYDQVMIYAFLVDFQIARGNLVAAIANCKTALEIAKNNKFEERSIELNYYLSRAYVESNKIEDALDIYYSLSENVNSHELTYVYYLMQLDFAKLNKQFENNEKALKIYLQVQDVHYPVFRENTSQRQNLLLNISELYFRQNKVDSSEAYMKRFEKLHHRNPDVARYNSNKIKGNIAYMKSDYQISIGYYDKCLKILEESYDDDLEVKLKKAQSYYMLKKLDSANIYLKVIDSSKNILRELSKKSISEFYKLSSNIHKEFGNEELSDDYFEHYINAREEFNILKFKAQEGLNEIKTKEIIADKTKTESKYKSYITYITSILSLLLISGVVFFVVKSNKNKKRFDELMATVKSYEEKQDDEKSTVKAVSIVEDLPRNIERVAKREIQTVEITGATIETEAVDLEENKSAEKGDAITHIDSSPIKDEKVQELLEKLEKLKGIGFFLKQECSLYNTAKRLKTNTSYLSSVINNSMNTNFNRYVNDIRMDYVILELKNNKRMRSYSVKGIAEEIGYKSADSFTKYFKESTGLSPSAFIRNLNKEFKI